MISLFQMKFLTQLNSHAHNVYINSDKTHFYSDILAILIRPSLFKWGILAIGPILPDCMVQQTFRRHSVQITALLVP